MGTAFVDVGEKEPTQGRILIFQVTNSKHKIETLSCVLHVCVCVWGGGGGWEGKKYM